MGGWRAIFLVAVSLAACATSPPAAPTAPADAYDGPSTIGPIDRDQLIDEALDPDALGVVLDQAGFASATSRRWRLSRTAGIREAEVRALRFASGGGATSYLAWVREHPQELVGQGTTTMDGDWVVAVHEPGGCCPGKDTSRVVVAWTDDDVVWMVRLGGPEADVATANQVADAIEEGTGTDGS